MEKHNEKWDIIENIYLKTAADVWIPSAITQDEYNYLVKIADFITNTPIEYLLQGKLLEDHSEEIINDCNDSEEFSK